MTDLFRSHSLEISKNSDGTSTTGSLTFWEDEPISPINIGDTFEPVPGTKLTVNKINISDEVIGERFGKTLRQWQITIEGSSDAQNDDNMNVIYNFSVERNSEGIDLISGTVEMTLADTNSYSLPLIGDKFNVPFIGPVECVAVKGNEEKSANGSSKWTMSYEGAGLLAGGNKLPNNEESISYELNGITVRAVNGDFLVLRRSSVPITKKSLTVYSKTSTPITTPGSSYASGIAIHENVSKENITVNGYIVGNYFRHEIEVEY